MKMFGTVALWWVTVSARETEAWARRPGASWPCSTLRGRRLRAEFDGRGNLVGLTVNGRRGDDVDGHEFNAIMADMVAPKARARGLAINC